MTAELRSKPKWVNTVAYACNHNTVSHSSPVLLQTPFWVLLCTASPLTPTTSPLLPIHFYHALSNPLQCKHSYCNFLIEYVFSLLLKSKSDFLSASPISSGTCFRRSCSSSLCLHSFVFSIPEQYFYKILSSFELYAPCSTVLYPSWLLYFAAQHYISYSNIYIFLRAFKTPCRWPVQLPCSQFVL